MNENNVIIHGGDVYGRDVQYDFSVSVSPLGTPSSVRNALLSVVAKVGAYPDPLQREFRERVAKVDGVRPTQVWGGNGASEFFPAIVDWLRPKRALIWTPSFYGYRRALAARGDCEIVEYPLEERDGFAPTDAALEAITDAIDVVFWANPNNPTGRIVPPDLTNRLLERCAATGTAVVVDESFLRMADGAESVRRRVDDFPNLYVVDSFTKLFAIPGVRAGYMIAREDNLKEIVARLPEWNMSSFAERAGLECLTYLEHDGYAKTTMNSVRYERRYVTGAFRKLGLRVYESGSNFFLFFSPKRDLAKRLLARKILIRDCRNFPGLTEGYYRVALLEHEKNRALVDALTAIFEETVKYERVAPEEIEERSFELIDQELARRGIAIPADRAFLVKRTIHTTADFDFAETLAISDGAIAAFAAAIRDGATIVTDTNMALAGINKSELARYGASARCFMADPDVAQEARERGVTRATVGMERALALETPCVVVVGNAPTALIRLREAYDSWARTPRVVVGVPVGFVNVEAAKDAIIDTSIPYIVNRGRKGGSSVAAAICNAILYEMRKGTL